ncbi:MULTISPECIES: hypothetical protein [unclassified Paenibacillus]|nr:MULTISPECIES: hypothetical protein [unclassified Paenibacillus]
MTARWVESVIEDKSGPEVWRYADPSEKRLLILPAAWLQWLNG